MNGPPQKKNPKPKGQYILGASQQFKHILMNIETPIHKKGPIDLRLHEQALNFQFSYLSNDSK